MRVQRFETLMRDMLDAADHPEITNVQTFAEAGYTDKPVGLVVSFASGSQVFVQFVRTSLGDDHSKPEYVVRKDDLL